MNKSLKNESFMATTLEMLDTTVNPCEDFYHFACGSWLKNAVIPEDKNTIDTSFSVVASNADEMVQNIIQMQPSDATNFYLSCMNEKSINAKGIHLLTTHLEHIDQLDTAAKLFEYAGRLVVDMSTEAFFDFYVAPDPKNTSCNAIVITQGGLSLPSVEYYENLNQYRGIFNQYVAKLTRIPTLTSLNASHFAARVLGVEKKFANITLPSASLRDPWAIYNKFTMKQIQNAYPLIASYLYGVQEKLLSSDIPVIIETPSFFQQQEVVLNSTSLHDIKAYLRFRLVDSQAYVLGAFFRKAKEKLSNKLEGEPLTKDRVKHCVHIVQDYLGDELGQIYMDNVFSDKAKASTLALINDIEYSMRLVLRNSSWLDASALSIGLEKIDKIRNFIGGPANITTPPFNISAVDFYDNLINYGRWYMNKSIDSLYHPVDKAAWDMSALTVNAYNDPMSNTIVFPAAILQPPLYDAEAFPVAVNYGRIGTIMGHELVHGFDDEGRNFDAQGQLKDWWSSVVEESFEEKTQCLVDQYSAFPIVSENGDKILGYVNGELTLGENIADNGGLKLAYMAYQRAKAMDPSIANIGYNDDKLYFIAFAQSWCEKRVDAYSSLLLNTDPHSPAQWRVNGVVSNSKEFASAFQCPEDSTMNPKKKCIVW
ncbi:endothelin-converting enzyme 1, metalloprotease family M13 [Thraustotheca clavata]|uniref:Endothelin-converting enzyme 1, metalloprotease family M13 n=1 Tax=Thraustotheca clavata TaxID=74557 RepID=A0A1W0A6S9_9STRA|nr:endothelin-converting enzyme 1, metalloprotease family M13 [Thraustotheca clavata]